MADMTSSLADSLIQNASVQTGQNALAKVTGQLASAGRTRAAQAAQDFEAVFIAEMLKPVFDSVEVDPLFGGGKGEEVFRGLLEQEYAKIIAKQGGIGLADDVMRDLIKAQESSQASTSTTLTTTGESV
ncbi:MAG: rod-binding protein [Pseudobdellovibrionaceae bacterium]